MGLYYFFKQPEDRINSPLTTRIQTEKPQGHEVRGYVACSYVDKKTSELPARE